MIDYGVKEKPLSNHPSNVKAKMTLLKFLNQKSFGLTLYWFMRGWGHDDGLTLIHPSYVICVMNKQQFITQVRILDFFQNGRLGSTEKNLASNKSFFQSGRWAALKKN
jgi:hypothetical protein